MKKVGKLLVPNQQLCFAHGLQLAVIDVLHKREKSLQISPNLKIILLTVIHPRMRKLRMIYWTTIIKK